MPAEPLQPVNNDEATPGFGRTASLPVGKFPLVATRGKRSTKFQSMIILMKRTFMLVSSAALLLFLAGCGKAPQKSDAELGLNAQQAQGRRVFEVYCSSCHHAYSSAGSKGPSLKRLFKKRFLPSGLPANDRFVQQTVLGGRGMMPGFGGVLTEKQMNDLMAYLHTL